MSEAKTEAEAAGEELVRKGYQAYGDQLGWAGVGSKPLLRWEDLPDKRKAALFAFTRAIVEGLQL